MYFLDAVVGPIYAMIALMYLIPILVAVTIVMLIVRWIKNKKDKDNHENNNP